jgi:hypothetical protein
MTVDDFEPGPQLVTSAGVPGCSSTAPSAEAVRFDPAWRTSTVLVIAAGIMERGNFDAMPILADALQDAGCDNVLLLEHCRHEVEHTMGCWVLELILSAKATPVSPPEPSVLAEAARCMVDPVLEPDAGAIRVAVLSFYFLVGTLSVVAFGLEPDPDAAGTMRWGALVVLLFLVVPSLVLYLWFLVVVVWYRRPRRRTQP